MTVVLVGSHTGCGYVIIGPGRSSRFHGISIATGLDQVVPLSEEDIEYNPKSNCASEVKVVG